MKFLHSVLVLLCVMGSGSYAQRTCYSCDSESNANCASLRVLPLPSKACEDPNEVECAVTVCKWDMQYFYLKKKKLHLVVSQIISWSAHYPWMQVRSGCSFCY